MTQLKKEQALNQLLFGQDARPSLDQLSKFLPENVVKEEGGPKNKEDIANKDLIAREGELPDKKRPIQANQTQTNERPHFKGPWHSI